MTRFLLLATAIIAGAYAAASWMFGMLTDAGVAGAISAACVLVAEGIGYCERRRDERARRTRREVWERRLGEVQHNNPHLTVIKGGREPAWLDEHHYTLNDVLTERARLWNERKPVTTTMTYDKHGEPISGYDSHGHSAVWPFAAGSPE